MVTARSLHRLTGVLLLSYVLVSSMWIPFAAAERSQFGPTLTTKMQERTAAPYREGELLIRFRTGTSQSIKDIIVSTHGAHRTKQLGGESSVEKLELPRGREWSAAVELLMNPQVEIAEPNFLMGRSSELLTHPGTAKVER